MIDRLLGALADFPVTMTPEEVCDALWLAPFLPFERLAVPPGLSGALGLPVPAAMTRPGSAEPTQPQADAGTVSLQRPLAGRAPSQLAGAGALAHLPVPGEAAGSRITATAGIPAMLALAGTREVSRALLPLRRRRESPPGSIVDEAGTAAAIADSGVWYPRLRPGQHRWLSLTLLVDDSESMAVWQQTGNELRVLLERLGAFNDLRTWHFDGDMAEEGFPRLRGESGQPVRRRQLFWPGARNLVLLLSDCVGAAWTSGSVAHLLEELSSVALVAILQPLPQWLWARCGPTFTPVEFHVAEPGFAARRLTAVARGAADATGVTGTAIPVLELEPRARWLASWASQVAGSGSAPGVALFTGAMTLPRTVGAAEGREPIGEAAALERVRGFRAASSPTAYELAGYLAAAPLSLPVMRLVQAAMLPTSRPAHLAEIFLGGLLCRADPNTADQDRHGYDFRAGVRELLLTSLTRADTLRVLRETSRFVSARLGAPADFPALLSDAGRIVDLGLPFARVAYTAMHALGGPYADVATRLEPGLATGNVEMLRPSDAGVALEPSREHGPLNMLERTAGPDIPEQTMPSPQLSRSENPPDTQGGVMTYPSFGPRTGPEQAELPSVFEGVPWRNPNFVGRDEQLDELSGTLSHEVTVLLPAALHGLGGVGKTQLAIEFAHRHAADYDVVWWIKAEEPGLIRESLEKLADRLRIERGADTEATARAVLEALRLGQVRRWLLVFDNADEPDQVEPYLPKMGGHVIVTSRNRKWIEAAKTIQVRVFTREESIKLIQRREPRISMVAADRLAARLGDLPLAVEQAAAYQSATGMSVDTYLELFEQAHERFLKENLPLDYPNSVAVTWHVGFDQLTGVSPAAAQLLQLSAFFGSQPISIHILAAGRLVQGMPDELAAVMQDRFLLYNAVGDIGRYALATPDPVNEGLQVHPLVQLVMRDWIAQREQDKQRALVHQMLAAANPGDPDAVTNWPRLAEINKHIVRSVGMIEGEGDGVRQVVVDQIRYLYLRGDYESSRELGETALLVWWEMYGADDALTLETCRQLGNTWRALGLTDEAREYNKDTLDRMRRVFGHDDVRTLELANSYGADLRIHGDLEEARELDEANLVRHKTVLGPDTRATWRCENNLAVDLRLAGQFSEALAIDQRLYQRRLDNLGRSDQDTLFSGCMVARDLRGSGQYREALEEYEQVLGEFTALLGRDHKDVLNARLSFGVTLQRAGQYEMARREVEDALADLRRRFGRNHPGSVAAMTILAGPLRQLGDVAAARRLADQALTIARRVHGPEHVYTLVYANNLAIALRAAGYFDVARRADEETYSEFTRLLGADHVFTLSSAANCAHSLYVSGSFAEAKQISRNTLERSKRVRGEDNPLTHLCACNLAIDLRASDEVDESAEANELNGHAVERLSALLGPDNPETAAARAGQRHDFDIEPPQF